MALFCVYELQSSVKGVKLILILHDQLSIYSYLGYIRELIRICCIYIYPEYTLTLLSPLPRQWGIKLIIYNYYI